MHCQNFTEDSDEIDMSHRNLVTTETSGLCRKQYSSHKYPQHHRMHRSLTRAEPCCKCGQPRQDVELEELKRRRKKRTKSKVQHCPSCHCPPETVKFSPVRANYPDNVQAVLERCEHVLAESPEPIVRKSRSGLFSPRECLCDRFASCSKRAKSGSRNRQQRDKQDTMILNVSRNILSSDFPNENAQSCYGNLQASKKNNGKTESQWRDLHFLPMTESSYVDNEYQGKYVSDHRHQKKVPTSRMDHRDLRECTKKMNELSVDVKSETEEKNDGWRQSFSHDDTGCSKLRFNLPEYEDSKKIEGQVEETEDDQKGQSKKKLNDFLGNYPALRSSKSKIAGFPAAMRNNVDDSTKNETPLVDTSDFSKSEDPQKVVDTELYRRPQKRSGLCKNIIYKPEEESTTNREDIREDTHCEIVLKDKNQETTVIRKNISAGGDLDLHATKSQILCLIDRALSNEFGSSSDQHKSLDSKQGTTQQEICIEIARALQDDCCQLLTQEFLSHRCISSDCMKQLKIRRWEHLNLIQEEFRKLCNLQKFLDTYSPRQSLQTLHSSSNTIESRTEKRNRQEQDGKQELTIVS